MSDAALETVALRDEGAALEAQFVPAAGMLCCSLRHRGEELLAQNAGVSAYARSGKTMGIPLLYPWANRLAGFDYSAAGKSVSVPHDADRVKLDDNGLPIHGVIGGRQAWEVTSGGDHERSSIDAQLSWSESQSQLFEVFPFRHELRYSARIHGGCLEIELAVHACGSDSVPLSFGFHPYLSPPGETRERWLVELPAMRSLALDERQIPTGASHPRGAERFELDGREFDDGFDDVEQAANFSVRGGERRIELSFVGGYPCAQVFAPAAGQFICFEPMTAPVNALRSGSGLRVLSPGERFLASFSVSVSDLR